MAGKLLVGLSKIALAPERKGVTDFLCLGDRRRWGLWLPLGHNGLYRKLKAVVEAGASVLFMPITE